MRSNKLSRASKGNKYHLKTQKRSLKRKSPRYELDPLNFLPIWTENLSPKEKVESLFQWSERESIIKNSKGDIFFHMKNIKAPKHWSQMAVDVVASKYFRKNQESSVEQLINRVVEAIEKQAIKQKYFSVQVAKRFGNELKYILYSQMASFNSPVWFNLGLFEKYKITSDAQMFSYDEKRKKILEMKNAFEKPQVSACFIQSIDDSLEGIFELAKTEARLFKFGSGSGTNFSKIRSKYESINAGGHSSGLITFLEVLDKGAGAIKSGGTSRRAAKMVCLDVDHPEIVDFIEWKKREEKKAQALIRAGYSSDYEGEAYKTVSGQNSNNSVRLSHDFLQAVQNQKKWSLLARSNKKKVIKEVFAQEIWEKIGESAWLCADPGVQYDDTIQKWHTCKSSDRIYSSNPCSEYMFLNDSACNLASINLLKFLKSDSSFDFESFTHVARLIFIAQEILIDTASYPTAKIAQNSHDYRPLGLGFANLGSLLMRMGLSYDSDRGRALASVITAQMSGVAYLTSAKLAKLKSPFSGYKKNKNSFLQVMNLHRNALNEIQWNLLDSELKKKTESLWQEVISLGKKFGFRNAQATVIAPTGTIGFMMDCDTTGIEPDFSLVKLKKLSGGGDLRIVNLSVEKTLLRLQYAPIQIQAILAHIENTGEILGAPYLDEKFYPIFKTANGKNALVPEAHLKMMAAVQPFLSGAISKTVNMPEKSTVDDILNIYFMAWQLGLKSVAVYRDNSKWSQPLNRAHQNMLCSECNVETELVSGCYRCPNCGTTVGCS